MQTTLRFLVLGMLFSNSAPLFAQTCGCTQCNVPIIANYDRNFFLDASNATFNNLATPQQGVCAVEIDLAHDFLSDLQISLTSPAGQTVQLVRDLNAVDTTHFSRWKIKFEPCGSTAMPDPGFLSNFDDNSNWPTSNTFTGSYFPSMGCLEDFNTGPVNGRWVLRVTSNGYRGVGFIYGFQLKFCQEAGLNCDGLQYALGGGEDCFNAEPLPTDIDTYIGNTAPYNQGFAPGFCGTIENDQWFSFVSTCDTVGFTITPGYCINGNGVQIALYDACFGNSPIACAQGMQGCGWCSWSIVANTTPGHEYYLLIDGWGGDQCDFEFTVPPSCISGLGDPDPPDEIVLNGCQGNSISIGLVSIPFGAAGYIWKATNGALVNGQTQVTVAGPENLQVEITFGSENGEICVAAYNFTDTTGFFCFPFTVDTNLFLVENAIVCYDYFPYYSAYEAFGVPPIFSPGTYHFTLQDYVDGNGVVHPCDVTLELHVSSEGGFYQLPTEISLGTQYVLPNGAIIDDSGLVFWSDTLISGCTNDYAQSIYLFDYLQNGDGCAPDTITFMLPGNMFLLCPGGIPGVISGNGPQKVVYQNSGVYDLIGKINGLTFNFNDTLKLNLSPSPLANFTSSVSQNVLTVNNLSQNASGYLWEFGDGATSMEFNPIHTYAAPGNYIVKLTVFGTCPGNIKSKNITISGQLPQAGFQVSDPEGCSPFIVQYTDQSIGSPGTWVWEFPGGVPASSVEENPIVTYNTPGTYSATLIFQNVFGQDTLTQTAIVQVKLAPQAIFQVNIAQNEIALINLSQDATDYFWDFGDGFTSTATSPSHTYAGSGDYLITLVANGECGTSSITQWISILGEAPQAAFQATPNAGCIPMFVAFQDLSAGNPTAWAWEFPGGTPSTSSEQMPTVLYISPGTFDATLTVQNAFGQSTLVQTAIVSTSPLPTVVFSTSINGLSIAFGNASQNANSYSWDFGDGSNSTEATPTHEYALPGTYLVTLQAINTCGNSILQQWVTVLASGVSAPQEIAWLNVSPNPSDGLFQLEIRDEPSPNLSWQLFNALGQSLFRRELGNLTGMLTEKLDFSLLPPAVYWLEVRTASKRSWVQIAIY